MNKFLTKIVGAALGLTLAIGVGVAVGVNQGDSREVSATSSPVTYSEVTFSGKLPSDGYWTNNNGKSYCGGWGNKASNPWSVSLDFDEATSIDWTTVDFSKTVSLTTTITAATNGGSGSISLTLDNSASQSNSKAISNFGSGSNSSSAKASSIDIQSVSSKFSTITLSFPEKSFITKFSCSLTFTEKAPATMYTVTDSITNGSLSSTDSIAENDPLNITINGDTGYARPNSLTVTMGGNTLTAGSGYTYDSSSGAFSIASVTGNVVIAGTCDPLPTYDVTYVAGTHGSGTNYVVKDQYAGSYTLIDYEDLEAEDFAADDGYIFKCYTVGGNEYNPGDEITLSANTTVTVTYDALPLSFEINETTFSKIGTGSGYTPYNGTRAISGYNITSNQVMVQSNKIQFQKTTGYLYNETAFNGIKLIRMTGCSGTINVSFDDDTAGSGSSSIGTLITAVTVGSARYYVPSIANAKYFHIASTSSDTPAFSTIEIYDYENAAIKFANDFVTAMATPCADENANNKSAVSAIWSTYKTGFEALTSDTKSEFGTSSNATVVQARSLYLHCVERYSLTTWTGAPAGSLVFNNNDSNNNVSTTTLVLIVISSISLVAVSSYFVIRRRREN